MIKQLEIDGSKKMFKISTFSALGGWDLQERFIQFRASKDAAFRREFTMEILAHASVLQGANELPLETAALVDNHLVKWENIKEVFEAVLIHNGIDPVTHGDRPDIWAEAGGMLAFSFINACGELMKPMIESMQETKGD